MTLKIGDLYKHFQDTSLALEVHRPDVEFDDFAAVESYSERSIVFNDDPAKMESLLASPPAAVVTSKELAQQFVQLDRVGVLVSSDVKLAHAKMRQVFDSVNYRRHEWPRVHSTAVVHESTILPESCTVAPGAVIGSHVSIGKDVVIQANAVIENDVSIGDESLVQAGAFIGRNCVIGNRVILKPGCVIGAEGFGFAQDEDKRFHRIPQKGIVVIEDDVVISSNANIDRATYLETRICRGTKIDALTHIAHNVFIDEDCVLVAQTGISGSTRFGKRVLASGQTGTLDHITVADDVVLVHRAGVNADILEPGMYAGGPVQPFRDYTRNISVFKKLSSLLQRVRALEKRLEELLAPTRK